MATFTLLLALSLLFAAGVINACETIPDVECSVVGARVTDGLPDDVPGPCHTCICIKRRGNQAMTVECCPTALMPMGYDESKCELQLNEERCMYIVREKDPPHKRCHFTGFQFGNYFP